MKKKLLILLTICFSYSVLNVASVFSADTSAKAAVVMEVDSARVLYSKNSNTKLPMASTTKIMTTLVAIESGKLNDTVTVSKKASGVEGSSIYLKVGEKLTVEELLYGIMLRSGNDASTAVAEYIGGSIEGFVEMMNKKALEIGAVNTHFANPHGLDANNHYTTAYDLALITAYALRNPKFAEIVKTKRKTISGPPGEAWERALTNKNKMLWQFEGGDGVKTGYTGNAGRCLVSSATRDNMHLVSVVLNCGPMWEESSALLNQSFSNFAKQKLVDSQKDRYEVIVKNGRDSFATIMPATDFYIPLRQGETDKISIVKNLIESSKAPIIKGKKAGELNIYLDKKHIGTVALVYCENIESNNPIYYIKRIIQSFLSIN